MQLNCEGIFRVSNEEICTLFTQFNVPFLLIPDKCKSLAATTCPAQRSPLPSPHSRVDMVTEYAPPSRAGSGRIHLITICFVKLTMERTERTTSAVPLPLALALHPFNRFTRLVWQIATAAQVLLALSPFPPLPTLPPVTTVDSPSLLLSPSLLCNPFNFRPNLKSNIDMCNSIASCCAGAERFVACGILYAFGQRGSGFAPLPRCPYAQTSRLF